MCGIVGVAAARPVPEELFERMLDSMFHRGPDGAGSTRNGNVALGMRRLAILDLERGQQPFFSDDGSVAVVMNGEIYNFHEVRRELSGRGVVFRTTCDTEVVPHAYQHFGLDGMLARLDGMYAIALHDQGHDRLHLVRDRFGEKPLFYSDHSDCFAFASHLPTLRLLPTVSDAVDPDALRHFLAMHFVAGPRTILRDVRRVPPGHRLELDLARGGPPRVTRWWDPRDAIAQCRVRRFDEAVARVRDALDHAVTSRLVADVELGVFLSGGIDSSAVAAVMASRGARVRTFSIGFEDAELDESEYARAVALHIGAEHHHFSFDLAACLATLDEAILGAGEPLGDPACLPVHLLSREARKHVKVVLSGEGADELFGGYGYYEPFAAESAQAAPNWRSRLAAALRSARGTWAPANTATAARFYRDDFTTPSGFPLLTTPAERDQLIAADAEDSDPWLAEVAARAAGSGSPLQGAQLADLESWLPDDLLPKLDRMTMAASLEARAPFLEPQLAALGLGLPDSFKIAAHVHKRVLRSAVAPLVPHHILNRRKQGFVLPMQRWLLGPLRERLLDELEGDRGDGLDAKRARELVHADLKRGAQRSRLLFALLAYRIWSRPTLGGPAAR